VGEAGDLHAVPFSLEKTLILVLTWSRVQALIHKIYISSPQSYSIAKEQSSWKKESFGCGVRIAIDVEKLVKKEVDLIVLNRAKGVLADEVIRKGRPIVVKDRGLFLEFLCILSDEAEDVREWIETSYRERHFEANR
jgi:hypothetical protein